MTEKPHGQSHLVSIRWYSACLPTDDFFESQNIVQLAAALRKPFEIGKMLIPVTMLTEF